MSEAMARIIFILPITVAISILFIGTIVLIVRDKKARYHYLIPSRYDS